MGTDTDNSVLNPLDPDYKVKLYLQLKDRGLNAEQIDTYFKMTDVDNQINDYKTGYYTNMFQQALRGETPDFETASNSLVALTAVNPKATALLTGYYPTAKEVQNAQIQAEKLNTTLAAKAQAQQAQNAFALKRDQTRYKNDLDKIRFGKDLDFRNQQNMAAIRTQMNAEGKLLDQKNRAEMADYFRKNGVINDEQYASYIMTGRLGKSGSSNSNNGNNDDMYRKYKDAVSSFEEKNKNVPVDSWAYQPDYKHYAHAKKELMRYTAPNYDTDNYNDLMSMADYYLANGKYTSQEIANIIRGVAGGELADNVLKDIDWSGYGRERPLDPRQQADMWSYATTLRESGMSKADVEKKLRETTDLADSIINSESWKNYN